MLKLRPLLIVLFAGFGTLIIFGLGAPSYFVERGFPLDDAWIHLVYGRSVSVSGELSYNLGTPSTGATSILWAGILGLIHLLTSDFESLIQTVKLTGWMLHLLTAVVLLALALDSESDRSHFATVTAVLFVAHPTLICASVSGMEIALTIFVVSLLALGVQKQNFGLVFVAALLAPLARPETSLFAVFLPLLGVGLQARTRLKKTIIASATGTAVAWLGMTVRNLQVTGRPLPSTFYAKVSGSESIVEKIANGTEMLLTYELVGASLPILVLFGYCVFDFVQSEREGRSPTVPRVVTMTAVSGVVFVVVSFALINPSDNFAFYHRRYPLPGLAMTIPSIAWLVSKALVSWRKSFNSFGLAGLVGVTILSSYVPAFPKEVSRLNNDAKNIDDVQVRIGLFLSDLPDEAVVWVVDAGASRYFGNGHFVDMLGLNTPQIISDDSTTYLDQHPPDVIEQVNLFNDIRFDIKPAQSQSFEPTTRYSVTSYKQMARHTLWKCQPGTAGTVYVKSIDRTLSFRCPE
jgi:hypothetical protein